MLSSFSGHMHHRRLSTGWAKYVRNPSRAYVPTYWSLRSSSASVCRSASTSTQYK